MADVTPLAKYDELAKQFKITEDKNVPIEQRLMFAREQAVQMKQIANRLLFDLTASHMHLNAAKDDTTKAAYQAKINEYERDLRQTSGGLDPILTLIQELELATDERSEP